MTFYGNFNKNKFITYKLYDRENETSNKILAHKNNKFSV